MASPRTYPYLVPFVKAFQPVRDNRRIADLDPDYSQGKCFTTESYDSGKMLAIVIIGCAVVVAAALVFGLINVALGPTPATMVRP